MSQQKTQTVQTTGHVWDDDLQEYSNPLPSWWLMGFYASVIVSLIYWMIYPTWPVGKHFTTGFSTVTYVNDKGQEKSWHWNTRAQLMKDMNEAEKMQKPYFDKVAAMPFADIAKDPELTNFVNSAGKAIFAENCAACHQTGGQGKVGFFPNLTDDDWLHGGTHAKIQETIAKGRHGYMPAFKEVLNDSQLDNLANYVASLAGEKADAAKVKAGDALFHGDDAACYYCHDNSAKGRQEIGSSNLSDKIWLWADVPAQSTPEKKVEAIRTVIANGLDRGVMPAWEERLKPEQIKLLTVYVHGLGGGKQ
ncbi:MAG: cytochrome-c oxidase, cbb3-type subunit III [Sulfurimicrobium sp.]|nr:cytochrome-c oxidase, cbb3-type subunit III [Sulfurimicrobium sp.]